MIDIKLLWILGQVYTPKSWIMKNEVCLCCFRCRHSWGQHLLFLGVPLTRDSKIFLFFFGLLVGSRHISLSGPPLLLGLLIWAALIFFSSLEVVPLTNVPLFHYHSLEAVLARHAQGHCGATVIFLIFINGFGLYGHQESTYHMIFILFADKKFNAVI